MPRGKIGIVLWCGEARAHCLRQRDGPGEDGQEKGREGGKKGGSLICKGTEGGAGGTCERNSGVLTEGRF